MLGASLTFAFAPFGHWYLVFVSLPLAFFLLAYCTDNIFWPSWWFSFGYFGAGISWVHVSIEEFGGLPLLASIGLMVVLCGYLAVFPALLFKVLKKYFNCAIWPLAIPIFWLAMEWARARFLSGFPWLSIGYSQSESILSSYLPLIGEIGLSALIILTCMSVAIGIGQKRYLSGLIPFFVLFATAFVLKPMTWTETTGETKRIALVQGNIPQSMRWDPAESLSTMEKYKSMSQAFWDHDIIIWPEAAVPHLETLAQEYLIELDNIAKDSQTGLITGILNYDAYTDVAFNSLIGLGIGHEENSLPYHIGHANRFNKHHLLPIGEFVPFENILRPLAPIFDLPQSSFTRGEYIQPNLMAGNVAFVPAICFEIAFPSQIAANITEQSQAIVTVSNDAWFGDSHGPHQHLQIAQVRAKEFGLPVLRATNNGVTAVVNHRGIITKQLPQFQDSVLSQTIQLVKGYTPYYQFGNWPIWLICLVLFAVGIYIKQQRQNVQ